MGGVVPYNLEHTKRGPVGMGAIWKIMLKTSRIHSCQKFGSKESPVRINKEKGLHMGNIGISL